MTTTSQAGHPASEIDSNYAWMRLAVVLLLGSIGSVGMWSFVVALPAVQADFGIARGEASLPFTLTMAGFGIGGIVMGRLADRWLAQGPPEQVWLFLRDDFRRLCARHGGIIGVKIRRPRILPLPALMPLADASG